MSSCSSTSSTNSTSTANSTISSTPTPTGTNKSNAVMAKTSYPWKLTGAGAVIVGGLLLAIQVVSGLRYRTLLSSRTLYKDWVGRAICPNLLTIGFLPYLLTCYKLSFPKKKLEIERLVNNFILFFFFFFSTFSVFFPSFSLLFLLSFV